MSFALSVKEEVISHSFNLEQKKSLLSGFIKHNGELIYSSKSEKLKISTISNKIARNLFGFCKELFDGEMEVSIITSELLKKTKTFQITLVGDIKKFLTDLKIYDENFNKIIRVDDNVIKEQDLIRSYIAGMFMAVGSVNAPTTTNYHLELQFKDKESAEYFIYIMEIYRFNFKILERKNNKFICYVKKTSFISDFLAFIDASQSVMAFENERISRDVYNSINRINNIDISNQNKTLKTGLEQVEQINFLKENKLFFTLSNKAKALSNLRLENPDSSYVELQEMMEDLGYQITKSGVSNLFKTIKKASGK
ncbi:DNA-binding protein WhiA [Mesoplasma photuris]|uniref:DNA-binding protein WhiA n=1 Tax=Mesoplasma photuris TaxID=217731 RepID=UPI0004E1A5A6|nr:DNA-binding protein WhiA [Mesoplasma photuris]